MPVLVSVNHALCGNPNESACQLGRSWHFSVGISIVGLGSLWQLPREVAEVRCPSAPQRGDAGPRGAPSLAQVDLQESL